MEFEITTTTTASPTRAPCAHPTFEAKVDVSRNEGDAGIEYSATLQIWCAACGLPMRFPGAGGHTMAMLAMVP